MQRNKEKYIYMFVLICTIHSTTITMFRAQRKAASDTIFSYFSLEELRRFKAQ